jgi:curved DNA-binding protein CbpA
MSNHYETLDVSPDATQEDIRAAYRKKARDNHPDREWGDEAQMALVNQAYAVLSDPERRARYDAGGSDQRLSDVEEKIAKGLVVIISKALEMAGNMITNATRIIKQEREQVREKIAEHKMLVLRAQTRKSMIAAKDDAPHGNIAHILLDQKIIANNQLVNQMEEHMLVLDGIEAELKVYTDHQADPVGDPYRGFHRIII